ncbi:hypothetical protein F0Z19_3831 [Vibrio cyclitrophicus]|nr:hypothetical protein F0Z19_3831 [Vibrio cyclitrophicus]
MDKPIYGLGSVMISEFDWPDGQKASSEEIKNYLKHLQTDRKKT